MSQLPEQPPSHQKPYPRQPEIPAARARRATASYQKASTGKRFVWAAFGLIGAVALVLGTFIRFNAASNDGATAAPGASVSVEGATTATATETISAPGPTTTMTETARVNDRRPSTTTEGRKTTADASKSEIGDGTYTVGSDIKPGTYKSSGDGRFTCYADTLSRAGSVLEHEMSQGTPIVIRISSSAYMFKSEGCGTWRKIK